MKNLMLLSAAALMLLTVACNKNQQAVKKLDGTWKVMTIDGQDVSGDNTTYTFNECKLKNDEYCTGTISAAGFGLSVEYKVIDDGETLVQKTSFFGVEEEVSAKIVELTKEKLVIETTSDSTTTTSELEKQD